jgi:chromosome partitioning protein
MQNILAIANQKGGVGKSTTAAAIGAELAQAGRKVLLIDLDPQSSLTQGLGFEAPGASMAEVIGGAQRGHMAIQDIVKTISPGLDLAPADIQLAANELGLISRIGRENVIKQALAYVRGYDLAIIDCPPALSLLTIGALVAAAAVIVPTLPSAGDLRGVKMFLGTMDQARELNPGLQLLGVVIVQYDPRFIAHAQALEAIKAAGLQVIGIIPRSVKAQEATAARQPINIYDPSGKIAEAYKPITRKVLSWLKNQP